MTIELWVLVYAAFLGIIQLIAATASPLGQPGFLEWTKGNRDTPYIATGKAAILQRAFKNFMETFIFFGVAVVALAFAHKSSNLSIWGAHIYLFARILYVPIYLIAIPPLRTLTWFVAAVGIGLCFATLFI
jgi:uncharacterized MAPEG superfamily protein